MTADNSFILSVNGSEICRGDNFQQVVDATVAGSLLHAGRNEMLARVVNGGDAPNPAGLIGKLVINLDNGRRIEQKTDAESWRSSAGEDHWAATRIVGPSVAAHGGRSRRMPRARRTWNGSTAVARTRISISSPILLIDRWM